MKRVITSIILVLISYVAVAQNRMEVQLPNIKNIETSGNVIVNIKTGSDNKLSAASNFSGKSDLSWEIRDQTTLLINLSKRFYQKSSDEATIVNLTLKEFDGITAKNGSIVIGDNNFELLSLRVNADGSSKVVLDVNVKALILDSSNGSKITVKGSADYLQSKAIYGSTIDAEELDAEIVNVNSNVSSESRVNGLSVITMSSSSMGVVYYKGDADVIIPISGNTSRMKKIVLKEEESVVFSSSED